MQINELFVSQRKLRNVNQLQSMIQSIEEGDPLPRIEIAVDQRGYCQVNDGHHRLTAYWLAGRQVLDRSEYLLFDADLKRPRFGRVCDLVLRCMQVAAAADD